MTDMVEVQLSSWAQWWSLESRDLRVGTDWVSCWDLDRWWGHKNQERRRKWGSCSTKQCIVELTEKNIKEFSSSLLWQWCEIQLNHQFPEYYHAEVLALIWTELGHCRQSIDLAVVNRSCWEASVNEWRCIHEHIWCVVSESTQFLVGVVVKELKKMYVEKILTSTENG